jgi:4-hydroxy-tetrahydrodipicolinate synthase
MFQGVIPAVCTWFTEDGRLDLETQFAHADFLIEGGVHGLFFQGSGGEFAYMDAAERRDHARAVVKHVAGRVPVFMGVSSNNADEAAALARHAQEVGADAVVAVTPYFWAVNEDSLVAYYAIIGRATGLPLFAYNFPAVTNHQIGARLLNRIIETVPTLAGVKDTIDSLSHIRDLVVRVKGPHPNFSVMAGMDEYLLSTLTAGGDGVIGSFINFAPRTLVGLYDAFREKDFDRVVALQRTVGRLAEVGVQSAPLVSALKEAALKVMGRRAGSNYVRPPLGRVTPDGAARIQKVLKEIPGL